MVVIAFSLVAFQVAASKMGTWAFATCSQLLSSEKL